MPKEQFTLSLRADLVRQLEFMFPDETVEQHLALSLEHAISQKVEEFRTVKKSKSRKKIRQRQLQRVNAFQTKMRKDVAAAKATRGAKNVSVLSQPEKHTRLKKATTHKAIDRKLAEGPHNPLLQIVCHATELSDSARSNYQLISDAIGELFTTEEDACSRTSELRILEAECKAISDESVVPDLCHPNKSYVVEPGKDEDELDFHRALGISIKEMRNERRLTRQQLAKETNLEVSAIRSAEIGKVRISTKHLFQIANAFSVQPGEIVKRAQQKRIGNLPSLFLDEDKTTTLPLFLLS